MVPQAFLPPPPMLTWNLLIQVPCRFWECQSKLMPVYPFYIVHFANDPRLIIAIHILSHIFGITLNWQASPLFLQILSPHHLQSTPYSLTKTPALLKTVLCRIITGREGGGVVIEDIVEIHHLQDPRWSFCYLYWCPSYRWRSNRLPSWLIHRPYNPYRLRHATTLSETNLVVARRT